MWYYFGVRLSPNCPVPGKYSCWPFVLAVSSLWLQYFNLSRPPVRCEGQRDDRILFLMQQIEMLLNNHLVVEITNLSCQFLDLILGAGFSAVEMTHYTAVPTQFAWRNISVLSSLKGRCSSVRNYEKRCSASPSYVKNRRNYTIFSWQSFGNIIRQYIH